ncbi:MAG: hypothetical protein R3A44_01920 [Caldilineaceae bacterium]
MALRTQLHNLRLQAFVDEYETLGLKRRPVSLVPREISGHPHVVSRVDRRDSQPAPAPHQRSPVSFRKELADFDFDAIPHLNQRCES